MNKIFLQLQLIDKDALKQLEKFKSVVTDIEKSSVDSAKKADKANTAAGKKKVSAERDAARIAAKAQRDAEKAARQNFSSNLKLQKIVENDLKKKQQVNDNLAKMAKKHQSEIQKRISTVEARAFKVIRERRAEEKRIESERKKDLAGREANTRKLARLNEARRRKELQDERRLTAELSKRRAIRRSQISGFFGGIAGIGPKGQMSFANTAAQIGISLFAAQRAFQGIGGALRELNQQSAFLKAFDIGQLTAARKSTFGLLSDETLQKQLTSMKMFGLSQKESSQLLTGSAALSRLDPGQDASMLADQMISAVQRGSALRIDNANASLSKFVQTLSEQTKGVKSAVERSRIFARILFDENGEVIKDIRNLGVLNRTLTTDIQGFFNQFEQLNTGFFKLAGSVGLLTTVIIAAATRIGIGAAGGILGGVTGSIGAAGGAIAPALALIPGIGPLLAGTAGIAKFAGTVLRSMVSVIASVATVLLPLMFGSMMIVAARALSIFKPEGSAGGQNILDKIIVFGDLAQSVFNAGFGGGDSVKLAATQVKSFKDTFGDAWKDLADRLFEAAHGARAFFKAFLQPIDIFARQLFGKDIFGKAGENIKRFVPIATSLGNTLGSLVVSLSQGGMRVFGALRSIVAGISENKGLFVAAADTLVRVINAMLRAGTVLSGGGEVTPITLPSVAASRLSMSNQEADKIQASIPSFGGFQSPAMAAAIDASRATLQARADRVRDSGVTGEGAEVWPGVKGFLGATLASGFAGSGAPLAGLMGGAKQSGSVMAESPDDADLFRIKALHEGVGREIGEISESLGTDRSEASEPRMISDMLKSLNGVINNLNKATNQFTRAVSAEGLNANY